MLICNRINVWNFSKRIVMKNCTVEVSHVFSLETHNFTGFFCSLSNRYYSDFLLAALECLLLRITKIVGKLCKKISVICSYTMLSLLVKSPVGHLTLYRCMFIQIIF